MVKSNIARLKYFTIELLATEKIMTIATKKVTTPQIFNQGNTFHPEGLFATEIFGEVGDKSRNRMNGHIDLKINVLHPLAYIGITTMSSVHAGILNSTIKAKWDKELKDFVVNEDGETGYNFFMKHLPNIEFKNPNNSDLREFKIKLVNIQKNIDILQTDKLFIVAAGLRDYTIDKSGRPAQDEINDYYRKILNLTNMLPDEADVGYNPFVDSIRLKIQKLFMEAYMYLITILDGKKGMIRGHMLSKTINYGTRNVITADNSVIKELGKGNHLRFNQMAVGLYQYAKAIQPIAIAKLRLLTDRVFSTTEKAATVIDTKTKKTSKISVDNKTIENYTSDKGLNSYLNKFSDNAFSTMVFGSNEHVFAMIHEKDNVISLVFDTNTIPEEEYKYLKPVTNLELLYIALVSEFDKYYASTTRYPAINQGSTYPIKPNVKPTTVMSNKIVSLDGYEFEVYNYPMMTSDIFDSMSPHTSKLSRLGADYDGDKLYVA